MKTFVKPQTFLKSHKPIHKPQTYAEQLQTLQPPKGNCLNRINIYFMFLIYNIPDVVTTNTYS